MRVIFETAGGQRLGTELAGEEWDRLIATLDLIFHNMRMESVTKQRVAERIRFGLKDYTLVAKEH